MRKRWGFRVVFLIGFLLCCLPTVFNFITRKKQAEAVATYQSAVEKEDSSLEDTRADAQLYNSMLWQSGEAVVDSLDTGILSDESYVSQMDVSGSGIMGSLDIPKINVELPIRHGTTEEVLSEGIGHIQGTSLPVGGENTHCVLTGHRGLPSSKLLTRLDEMAEGDYFFLRTCGETLAYRVCEIRTIEPENVSVLEIREGEDLVSVVTCTPYGLNTHRLIVTGERVEYDEAGYHAIRAAVPSGREMIFTLLPFLFAALAAGVYIRDWRRDKKRRRRSEWYRYRNRRRVSEANEQMEKH